MANIYLAQGAGNIDAANMWRRTDGTYLANLAGLAADDILVANNYIITVNAAFVCGTITTAATGGGAAGGYFALDRTVAFTANCVAGTLNCMRIATTNAITVTITGNISAGGSGAHGLWVIAGNLATIINITGNVYGTANSAALSTYGIMVSAACTINITGSSSGAIVGGASISGYGLYNGAGLIALNVIGGLAAGTGCAAIYTYPVAGIPLPSHRITVTNGNLINGATGVVMFRSGGSNIYYNPGANNYIQYPMADGTSKCGKEPVAGDVRSGVSVGSIAGTLTLPTVDQVIEGVSFGGTTGVYHEATAAEVESGVQFGPSSAFTGVLSAGGGPLVGDGNLVL